jgi:PAS domain S-box-containing protein
MPSTALPTFDASTELTGGVLEISVDCVKVLDTDGNLLFMNQNGMCVMEIEDFKTVQGRHWPLLWPESTRPIVQDAVETAMRGQLAHFVAECPTAKGTMKWWDVTVTLLPQPDGNPTRLISVSRDITAQREAEKILRASNEQMQIATREMAHRINNTLAVVQSIIGQTAKTTPDPKDFSAAVSKRIAAMANANRALASGQWDGANLESLIKDELGAHIGEGESRVRISGPVVALPPTSVTAFALVIHELATNAAKYGALSGDHGHVDISWGVSPGAKGQSSLLFYWRECDGPPVSEPKRRGFGSVLLDRGVDDCKVSRTFDPAGVQCRIELPL